MSAIAMTYLIKGYILFTLLTIGSSQLHTFSPQTFTFRPSSAKAQCPRDGRLVERQSFLDGLVTNMTIPELGWW